VLIESCAEGASGDSQGRAPRSQSDDLQMGFEARWLVALCDGN
jgi:hypothetical protein